MPNVAGQSVAAQLATTLSRPGLLAPLPEVALAAMQLADDPNAVDADLERVLSRDAALSARVLQVANSAFFGARAEVNTLHAAIRLMGFGAIKNIAVAASLTRTFRSLRVAGSFDPRALWTHSVAVGTATRLMAARARIDPGEAFLAGLMHDIGVIVELQLSYEDFLDVIGQVERDATLSFRSVESGLFGATHEDYGKALAIAWNFPVQFRQVCGFHHCPVLARIDARKLTTAVHLADVIAAQVGIGYVRTLETDVIDLELANSIGLSSPDLDTIRARLEADVGIALSVLS